MSIDNLKADLASNMASLNQLGPLASGADVVAHLQNTLWPFLETVVSEMEEQDECLEDLIHGADDILQPETAKVFAGVITGGLAMAERLKALSASEPQVLAAIAKYQKMCQEAAELLEQITIVPAEDGDDEDDGEDGESDDDEEDNDDDDE